MVRVLLRWQRRIYLNRKEINLNIIKTDDLTNRELKYESLNSEHYWRCLSPRQLKLIWNPVTEYYETKDEFLEGKYHSALDIDGILHRLLPFRIVSLSYCIFLSSANINHSMSGSCENISSSPDKRPFGSALLSCEEKLGDRLSQSRKYSSEKSKLDRLSTKDPISHPSVHLIYLLHNTAEKLRNELNMKKEEIKHLKRQLGHEKRLTSQLLFEKHEFLDIINNLFQETMLVKVPDEHLVSEAHLSPDEKKPGHNESINRYYLEEVHYKATQGNKKVSGEETTIDEIHLVFEDDKSNSSNLKDFACDKTDYSEGLSKPAEISSSQESFESASCSKVFDCDESCSMSVEKETKGIQTVISTLPKKAHISSSVSDNDFSYNTFPASFAKKKLHFISNGVSKSVTSDYCSRSSSILSKPENKEVAAHACQWIAQSHSLPELAIFQKALYNSDSGGSTDSLLDEADQFLEEHISEPLSSTPKYFRKRTKHGRDNFKFVEDTCKGSFCPFVPERVSDIKLNYRIKVMLKKFRPATGQVRFVGTVLGEKEPIIGVELDVPEGDSDGIYKGQLLFKTNPGKAAFVRLGKVVMAWPDSDD